MCQLTDQFAVGDLARRSHTFTGGQFAEFAAVSGDANPIHHDPQWAAGTEFGAPIVPLAMAIGPVSALVGMDIPGPGAVILDASFRPVRAIRFDQEVRYSVRVRSASAATQVLTLGVRAVQDGQVVLDGEVQATRRHAGPAGVRAVDRPLAAVTGAAGDLGGALAVELATAGWDVVLLHRDSRVDRVAERCRAAGAAVTTVAADLTSPEDRAAAAKLLRDKEPAALIHAAAAPVDASAATQLEVGYAALRELADAVLDGMLVRQQGWLVLIGSTATRYHPRGFADYIAAKSAAESVLHGVHRNAGGYGVRCVLACPGYLSGRYSEGVRPAGAVPLAPEEVAEAVVRELAAGESARLVLQPEGTLRESLSGVPVATAASAVRAEAAPPPAPTSDVRERVYACVRRVLDLGPEVDVSAGGVGVTAGWDSLRQIRIVLAVEEAFGITLAAADLAAAGDVRRLCELVERAA